ncbi:MAG TPA: hypothetical protein VGB69_05700 [Edaphobacter sp.]
MKRNDRKRPPMKPAHALCRSALFLLLGATAAWGQEGPGSPRPEATAIQIYHFKNSTQQADENECVTALRNTLPASAKLTLVAAQNLLVINATPDQVATARKLLDDIDRPRKAYRLTYTIIDMDGTKRIGEQHYSMVVVSGQKTMMKQGSRMPLVVSDPKSSAQSPVAYIDVGMTFEATLSEGSNGAGLKTKVERSSISEERSGLGPQDPIIRQSLLEGTSVVTPGKPLTLGSFDILDSTRHLDVQVTLESLAP